MNAISLTDREGAELDRPLCRSRRIEAGGYGIGSLPADGKKKPLLWVASSLDFVYTATDPFSGFFFLNCQYACPLPILRDTFLHEHFRDCPGSFAVVLFKPMNKVRTVRNGASRAGSSIGKAAGRHWAPTGLRPGRTPRGAQEQREVRREIHKQR